MKQNDENGTQSALQPTSGRRPGFTGGQILLTFVAGAAAGAIAAFLVAPKTGGEMRDRIKQIAGGSKEKLGRVPAALVDAKAAATHAFKEAMGSDSVDSTKAAKAPLV